MLTMSVLMMVDIGMNTARSKSSKSTAAAKQDELSDEELVFAYAKGNLRAFEQLYQRYRKPVYNYILRFIGSPEPAEELTQEVFLRVIQKAGNFVQRAKFRTWLYTIARNLCVDFYRREKHRTTISFEKTVRYGTNYLVLGEIFEDTSLEGDGENILFRKEFQLAMRKAILELPEKQRAVFLLREVSSLPYKEIAIAVGEGESTVKSQMRYAVKKLRKSLKKMGFSKKDLVC